MLASCRVGSLTRFAFILGFGADSRDCNRCARSEEEFLSSLHFSVDTYVCSMYIRQHEASIDVPVRVSDRRSQAAVEANGTQGIGTDSAFH